MILRIDFKVSSVSPLEGLRKVEFSALNEGSFQWVCSGS